MTATPPVNDTQAQYDGLKQLLPKLAQPSWVWQIGTPITKSAILEALEAESQRNDDAMYQEDGRVLSKAEALAFNKKAKKKAAKRKYNAYKRLHHAIRGTPA